MRIDAVPLLLAFAVSLATLVALLRLRALPLDVPNQRSVHDRPVPRSGGLAIWTGWGVALTYLGTAGPWLLPALALAVLSYGDDRIGLSVALRLPAHLLAATLFVWFGLPPLDLAVRLMLILALVWMLNLFNFMDGVDGLAGGTASIGFGALALACAQAGTTELTPQLLALVAACVAFLGFNWSPAKVFLGDVGSIPLGFLAAAIGIQGWSMDLWPWWFPILIFLPLIADASFTLAKRAWRRERIWEAHREHAYQKLVLLGWSHAKTSASYLALTAASNLLALLLLWRAPHLGPLALASAALALALLYCWIMWHFARVREPRHAQ